MKKILGVMLLLTLVVSLVACSNGESFDFEQDVIVVGLEADYPPFNWSETSANDYNYPISENEGFFAAGYDVEIAKIIADQLNMTLEIKMIEWGSLVPSLKSNHIDLIIAGMSPTEERMKSISFTNAYFSVNHVIVTTKESSLNGLSDLNDLEGMKGLGQANTVYAELIEFAANKFGSTVLPERDNVPEISTAITTGVADFTIVELPVAQGMVEQTAGKDVELVIAYEPDHALNIFELEDADRILSIGTRKVDSKLIEEVNKVLANISQATRDSLMDEAINRAA